MKREVFIQHNLDVWSSLPALVRKKNVGKREDGSFAVFSPFHLVSLPSAPQALFHLRFCTHWSKQAVLYVKYDLACFWHGNCKRIDFISRKLTRSEFEFASKDSLSAHQIATSRTWMCATAWAMNRTVKIQPLLWLKPLYQVTRKLWPIYLNTVPQSTSQR